MATGARNQQTGRAGEYFAAAELNRRGAYAVTFAGNMPRIDILASNLERTRTVNIQVKSRRSGTWQTSVDEGRKCKRSSNETNFWIFVDLQDEGALPGYYIVPEWWIRNNIYETNQAYLAKHGGSRKINPNSKHHGISVKRISQWKDRWDLLKIF
jgi:Holliday junction resolvase-like predicted endonuclease